MMKIVWTPLVLSVVTWWLVNSTLHGYGTTGSPLGLIPYAVILGSVIYVAVKLALRDRIVKSE